MNYNTVNVITIEKFIDHKSETIFQLEEVNNLLVSPPYGKLSSNIFSLSLGKCIGIVCRLSNSVLSIIEMDLAYCNGSHTQTLRLLFQEAWRNVVVAASG